ncbi:MAG: hypothetical protein CM1200mP40_22920 [Gammaproteobacteria bacterium]|nr:MAG: hypothetical protein CM1200mP40_22920 [Gammaproteobacteria bacterium]
MNFSRASSCNQRSYCKLKTRTRSSIGTRIASWFSHDEIQSWDTIAFLTLDDRSGRFEVSLFAKEYEKYRELIQRDLILVVECTVSVDDYTGGMRGRAKQVMTLAQARKKFAHRLALNLSSEDFSQGFVSTWRIYSSPTERNLQNQTIPSLRVPALPIFRKMKRNPLKTAPGGMSGSHQLPAPGLERVYNARPRLDCISS